MTSPWQRLAEARILEWQRRRARGEPEPHVDRLAQESGENYLFRQVVDCIEQARSASGALRQALLAEAREKELQLMVRLELEGLVLMAERLASELERLRGHSQR